MPVPLAHVEQLAVFVADHTYRFSAQAEMVDQYVHAYFFAVTRYLWDCISARGVRFFYVLDNTIREDRFKLAYDLFLRSGVAVVTPYDWKSEQTWELAERHLRLHLMAGRHIVYIEKDASVNYLNRVLEVARRSLHKTVLRNRAPDDPMVTWIQNEPPTLS